MPPPNRSVYRIGWRLHRFIWNLSGGLLGSRSVGMPVLELTTTGRRTGEPRSVLLTYLDHPDGWVVIASNLGSDRHPAWWLNLQAGQAASVQTKDDRTAVSAVELTGDERADYWDRAVALNEGYAEYLDLTDRTIPVVLLRRA